MSTRDEIAIKVTNVSKSFKLPHEKNSSIKSLVLHPFKKRTFEKQEVLKDINFEIKKGEFFGIVGRNGSGKSTLLKLLAGIYSPNKGHIQVNGKLTPFIELGVGFNPELTGRENVFLNGALLGFNRKEMTAMYNEIVEFAELEKFMDQKLKNYSSGMQVRLAFSIAIRANTEILLLDEVLAVGDTNFQRKCYEYFAEIKNSGKTVILVTHDMGVAKRYCDRSILINKGKILKIGQTDMVASEYERLNTLRREDALNKKNRSNTELNNIDKPLSIKRIEMTCSGEKRSVFSPNEKITIECEISSKIDIKAAGITLKCNNPGGPAIFSVDTNVKAIRVPIKTGSTTSVKWTFDNIFNDGKYEVSVLVGDNKTSILHLVATSVCQFEISGWINPYSIVHLKSDKLEISNI